MRVATIDIGTNSVLLLIAAAQDGGLRPLVEKATITRLGQGVDAKRGLAAEAEQRTLDCLAGYAALIDENEVERVAVVGTSAMRDAGGGEFARRVSQLLGVEAEVISGEREARLTFEGSLCGLPEQGAVTVVDIGGGSTEIILGHGKDGSVQSAVSLDVGAVRLSERHIRHDPPLAVELGQLQAATQRSLEMAPRSHGRPLVGVAGTVTTLAAYIHNIAPYSSEQVHGSSLSREDLERAADALAALTTAQRTKIPSIHPKRADIIVAGAFLLSALMDHFASEHLLVSDRGVRWGLARELLQLNKEPSSPR